MLLVCVLIRVLVALIIIDCAHSHCIATLAGFRINGPSYALQASMLLCAKQCEVSSPTLFVSLSSGKCLKLQDILILSLCDGVVKL